jgi:hypothetical protein
MRPPEPVLARSADLWRDVRYASSWRDRLGYLFMPPDWQPGAAGPAAAE